MSSDAAQLAAAERLGICIPEPDTPSAALLVGNYTLHELWRLIAYIVVPITVVNSILLVASHLRYRANIAEQRNIIRIATLPAFYGITSLFAVVFYGSGTFLDPVARTYEILSVASFYQFCLHLITPDETTRDAYFIGLERQARFSAKRIHNNGSLRWFRVQSALVYQAVVLSFAITIIYEVVGGVVCATSTGNKNARIILGVISFLSNILALTTIARLYFRLRSQFKPHHVASTFWYYKLMIGLIIFSEFIYSMLEVSSAVTPTKYMSYGDFLFGLEEFITLSFAFIFSFVYWVGFFPTKYRSMLRTRSSAEDPDAPRHPDASIGRYLLAAFWPSDIACGVVEMFVFLATLPKGRKAFDYTGGSGVSFLDRERDAKLQTTSSSDNSVMQSISSNVGLA